VFIGDDRRRKAMTPTLTPPPETVAPPAADERCDAGGSELVFCGHHANKYAEELVKITVRYATDPEFTWRGAELMAN